MASDARALLSQAERIVIGAGSGLSTSGGINYDSPELFQALYPEFAQRGNRTIWQTICSFWNLTDANETKFWGFLSHHVEVNAAIPALPPYLDLFQYLQNKDYFVVTTNVDQQFQKAHFPLDRLWTMQGNYSCFQCETPCEHKIYDNSRMIRRMKATFNAETLEVARETVPRCPNCGLHLVPNLRKDASFVEEPHVVNKSLYHQFLSESKGKRVVFLEFGVGFNSPGAIKYPFEQLVATNPTFCLIRVNLDNHEFPLPIRGKSILVQEDIGTFIESLL
jgi:NAD-dependent SIR2 family protein deacetylase